MVRSDDANQSALIRLDYLRIVRRDWPVVGESMEGAIRADHFPSITLMPSQSAPTKPATITVMTALKV